MAAICIQVAKAEETAGNTSSLTRATKVCFKLFLQKQVFIFF